MNRIASIISCIASFASILSLAFIQNIPFNIRVGVVSFSFFCLGWLVFSAIQNNLRNERICKNTKEINSAMRELVGSEGEICVVSGSLRWVDEETERVIVENKNSILIFIEKESALSKKLIDQGVTIKYYGQYNCKLRSRFTAIRYNRENPQIAIASTSNLIGRKNSMQHIIYQTNNQDLYYDQWINALGIDVIDVLYALCQINISSN